MANIRQNSNRQLQISDQKLCVLIILILPLNFPKCWVVIHKFCASEQKIWNKNRFQYRFQLLTIFQQSQNSGAHDASALTQTHAPTLTVSAGPIQTMCLIFYALL